jgi:hypothetical protein
MRVFTIECVVVLAKHQNDDEANNGHVRTRSSITRDARAVPSVHVDRWVLRAHGECAHSEHSNRERAGVGQLRYCIKMHSRPTSVADAPHNALCA